MKHHRITLVLVLILTALLGGTALLLASAPAQQSRAYIEPGLQLIEAETVSVIVTAADSQLAAEAVEGQGGQVSTELWLIDAVAARLPGDRIDALATSPGIVSIVGNKGVEAAQGPDWDGWMTDRRIMKTSYLLAGSPSTPAVPLPDGGIISVAENGAVLILNADSSERVRATLSGGPYKTAPAIGADGTIYLAGEDLAVIALYPDGSLRWNFEATGATKFLAGVTLGPDGTVYVADEGGSVFALAGSTGQKLWQFNLTGDQPGQVVASPVVGADGTLYVVSKGAGSAPKGHLFALDPAGYVKWTFMANPYNPFELSPQIDPDGTIYVASSGPEIYAVYPNGTLKYQFSAAGNHVAQPALANDGSLFVAAQGSILYGLNPDGSLRFQYVPNGNLTFETGPVLAPDGSQVYIAARQRKFFALDTASGQQAWQYSASGDLLAAPVVEANGHIHLVTTQGRYIILTPAGWEYAFYDGFQAINQSPTVIARGQVVFAAGPQTLAVLGRMPEAWDGRPDVQPGSNWKEYDLVNPVTIDVGADVLHVPPDQDGQPITGDGVTIAVLDSGTYFNQEVKQVLGNEVRRSFMGQADFVDEVCETYVNEFGEVVTLGLQYDGFCFTDWQTSTDVYGHGSHVSGIAWNSLTDTNTGVWMGIAPGANVVSVRVLGDDGFGT
jgi:outer membrane protein assembly factor BamB